MQKNVYIPTLNPVGRGDINETTIIADMSIIFE